MIYPNFWTQEKGQHFLHIVIFFQEDRRDSQQEWERKRREVGEVNDAEKVWIQFQEARFQRSVYLLD